MIRIEEDQGHYASLTDEIRLAFSKKGLLSQSKQFEYRAEQQDLAVAITKALSKQESLIAEAGTGVGKSLAYLLPSIQYALASEKKCLISTNTINLQEQLLYKDVPLAVKLIGQPVRFALLKGRQNYLCPFRLKRALQGKADLFTSSEANELKRIWEWSQETEEGTVQDLDFKPSYRVWTQVCSESELCVQRRCGPTGKCFFQEARKLAMEAQVVILNHTLFFSIVDPNVSSEENGFLFPNDFVVFDEAHTIENVAAKQLGLRVSAAGLRSELNKVYNPRSRKGILKSVQRPDLADKVENVNHAAGQFFDELKEVVFEGERYAKEVRIQEVDIVPNSLSEPVRVLRQELAELSEDQESELLQAEINDAVKKLGDVEMGVTEFLNMEDESSVYWVEESKGDHGTVTLHSAPVNVADRLRDFLFANNKSTIMLSATLSTSSDSLEYYKNRIGAESVDELMVGSPFDLERQMKTFVAGGMSDPRDEGYQKELLTWVNAALKFGKGRAFVLFTSYYLMQSIGQQVRELCRERGWECFIQGEGVSRQAMLDGFRESKNAVLLGTDSFWTGVDVPGESLSNIIITRLPFEVPSHPVVAARTEKIEKEGGSSFMDYSLPEAILKFRQGVGRLIRSQRDTGNIFILDSRTVNKRYGKRFIECLLPSPITVLKSPSDL